MSLYSGASRLHVKCFPHRQICGGAPQNQHRPPHIAFSFLSRARETAHQKNDGEATKLRHVRRYLAKSNLNFPRLSYGTNAEVSQPVWSAPFDNMGAERKEAALPGASQQIAADCRQCVPGVTRRHGADQLNSYLARALLPAYMQKLFTIFSGFNQCCSRINTGSGRARDRFVRH